MESNDATLGAALRSDHRSRHPDVTGWERSHEYFRFVEADAVQPSLVVDVLRGQRLGVVFRGVVERATRDALIANFLTSPGRRTRGADAPGEFQGAYHYSKTIDEYLGDSDAIRADLEAALDVPSEPLAALFQQLHEALASFGVGFRLARP
jgi:hypothetical protein